MIEDRFGAGPPWSVGVEEELMILDGETLELVPRVDDLLAEVPPGVPGELKTELFASVVELTTGICRDAAQAGERLAVLRAAAAEAAGRLGLRVAALGSHPTSPPLEQAIADDERYAAFVDYAGVTARRQGVSGLHVHVGMPDGETCHRVLEALLPWLPAVLAVSANSPYLDGAETGYLSARAEVLATLPRAGAPPAFGSYAGWEAFVERWQRAGVPLTQDYRSFWWDVRLHPFFGTLEIRMPDQPTSLERTIAIAGLLQRLCRELADADAVPADAARRGDYAQNRWAAARFGPAAVLLHPDGDRTATAAELIEELGGGGLEGPCEAEEQLELGRSDGLQALCAELVARTVG